ncbi:hypothetical protein NU768_000860 [Vibrio vulnificus]|nr:hypothetical protein [Vibrio vulnificus]
MEINKEAIKFIETIYTGAITNTKSGIGQKRLIPSQEELEACGFYQFTVCDESGVGKDFLVVDSEIYLLEEDYMVLIDFD